MGWIIAIMLLVAGLPIEATIVMVVYFALIVWLNYRGTK